MAQYAVVVTWGSGVVAGVIRCAITPYGPGIFLISYPRPLGVPVIWVGPFREGRFPEAS